MEFTRQHVEHIVGRHHALARKFEALKGKFEGITAGTVETLEVSAGALLGGVIDGRWGSKEKGLPTLMHIPITLGGGILLNVLGPIIVYTTLTIPSVMLLEAFLSFLGLGVQPPMSSWGADQGWRGEDGGVPLAAAFPGHGLLADPLLAELPRRRAAGRA